jgi:hypothetical protein
MGKGVAESDIFLLFLSSGVLSRPFVQYELRQAKSLNKRIVTVYETDERHGQLDFASEKINCPEDLQFVLADIEAIPYRRRKYERQAMMEQVRRYAGSSRPGRIRSQSQRPCSLQIMVRAGEQYHKQLKHIDKSHINQRQGRAQSTAVQGLWFMETTHLRSTASRWHSKYTIRVLMLVMLVPYCLSRAKQTRVENGIEV